jgi:asparagine N-glycosylation enzyme membrane subunit Stt3
MMNTTAGLIVHIAITIVVCTGVFFTQRNRYHFFCAGLILVFFGLFILLTGKYPGRSISDITGFHRIVSGFVTVVCGGVMFLVKPRHR